MDRVFYQAASSMMLQQRKLEVASNNIANIKTAGYKPETVATKSFVQILQGRLDEDGIYYDNNEIGKRAPVQIVDEVMQYFSQGDIDSTGRAFDFAISGEGYFNIMDTDGNEFYTRNGAFRLDEEGYLAFGNYGRVQGENGDIYLGNDNFQVSDDGRIFDSENEVIDRFKISWCDNVNDLQRQSNGMFTYEGEDEMYDYQTTIYQNALEKSTVDLSTEMTRVMAIQSRFTAMSQVLKTINSINESAATQIGKV